MDNPEAPGPRKRLSLARRLLLWGSTIGLALAFVAPLDSALGLTLISYPALAVGIFLTWFPNISTGRQDQFLRILVGVGVAAASGIGAALLVFITCLGSIAARGAFR